MTTKKEAVAGSESKAPSTSPAVPSNAESPTAEDLVALRAWAQVGMMLDQMLGVKGQDDVSITTAKVKTSSESLGVMWIFTGQRKRDRVVTFHKGHLAADALFRFARRRAAGEVVWRLDEQLPPPAHTRGGDADGLPPAPAVGMAVGGV